MLKVKVKAKREIAQDICAFELVDHLGQALPRFTAGAHIDVHIPGNYVRQYSLCNSSDESHRYVIAVLRESASRGGSTAMHRLQEGAMLQINPPKNHFPLDHDAPHSILVAGGIGLTPLLSMANELAASGRSFELHYCVRSRSKLAFRDQLDDSRFRSRTSIHIDEELDSHFDAAKTFLHNKDREAHVYVCGPSGFIEYVLKCAREAGYPEARLHREYFGAADTQSTQDDGPFTLQIASTGQTVSVASGESAVAALARHGIEVPVSCEQGVCGTCVTRICSGVPLHRDLFLTDEEHLANDRFTPCCSRSISPILVLDL
ncbi:PDR/VanB family oxidoreductase [Burkholderia anthina]|uniref:PDR/VanB family oxidoreductase n=1 Tax=Burkholderia anthina TaxID=179879 RepID=UPI001588D2AB|nr:PDR/VanB family oxidoreductase [Burkholderia anthina]